MNRSWSIISIVLAIMICCITPACTQGGVSWEDPKGDVYGFEKVNKPFLDIVGARAEGKDGYLILEAIADKDLEQYFSFKNKDGYRFGYRPVSFFIDSDNNPDTGGIPEWIGNKPEEIRGYNSHVEVLLGFLFKQEGTDKPGTEFGDMKIEPARNIISGAVTYQIERSTGRDSWESVMRDPKDWGSNFNDLASYKVNKIILKVPYEFLGVKKGQTIRLTVKEEGQDSKDLEKFSVNQELLLN